MPKSTRIAKSNRLSPSPEQNSVTLTSKGFQIRLHVKPNSKVDRITDVQTDCIHVAVTDEAREGEANRGVMTFISGVLGLRKSDAVIVAGQKSCDKVMLIRNDNSRASEEEQSKEIIAILEKLQQAVGR